jgi:hypothetical protein
MWSALAALAVAVAAWVVPMLAGGSPVGPSAASGQIGPICTFVGGSGPVCPPATASPSPSPSPSPVATQTATASATATETASATVTETATASPTTSATATTSATRTPSGEVRLTLFVPKGQKTGDVRRDGLRVKAACSTDCALVVRVFRKGKRLGTVRRVLTRKGTVHVEFNRRGKRALRRRRAVVDVLGLAASGDGRKSDAVAKKATIRRRR